MHLLTFSSEAYQLDVSKWQLRCLGCFFLFVHLLTDTWIDSLENRFLAVTFSPRLMIFALRQQPGYSQLTGKKKISKLNSHLSYSLVSISGFNQLCLHSSVLLFQRTKPAGNSLTHTHAHSALKKILFRFHYRNGPVVSCDERVFYTLTGATLQTFLIKTFPRSWLCEQSLYLYSTYAQYIPLIPRMAVRNSQETALEARPCL